MVVLLLCFYFNYLVDCTLGYTLVESGQTGDPSLTYHFVQSLFNEEQISAPDFYFNNTFKVCI